jgi:hypothetical protein
VTSRGQTRSKHTIIDWVNPALEAGIFKSAEFSIPPNQILAERKYFRKYGMYSTLRREVRVDWESLNPRDSRDDNFRTFPTTDLSSSNSFINGTITTFSASLTTLKTDLFHFYFSSSPTSQKNSLSLLSLAAQATVPQRMQNCP